MSAVEIVVIGGGVGGLTAAVALAQGGHRVQVLERASRFARPGPAVRLAPNATAILARLGLLDHLLDLGSRPRRALMRDLGSGAELAELDLGAPLTARYGTPYIVIGRADLLSLLADACVDADVELRTGREAMAIDQSAFASSVMGGALVTSTDGRVYTGDVVVAADGTRSVTSSLISGGDESGDGWAAYRGTVPATSLPLNEALAGDVVAWMGPDAHFTRYPVRTGEVFEQVAVFRSKQYERARDGVRWGGPDELQSAFASCAPAVRTGLAWLRRDQCQRMLDRAPLAAWVAGRVALLGDAVHPMPGYLAQGGCQAIEDAAALAAALADCPGPQRVPEALDAYQALRVPRATRVSRARRVWETEPVTGRPADDYAVSDWLYAPASR
jgi:3-hydroxybenzoate 6-monooxygenase